MSKNNEKDTPNDVANERLLAVASLNGEEVQEVEMSERCPRNGEPAATMVDVVGTTATPTTTGTGTGTGTDDDPPPYTAVAPSNQSGWAFSFPGGIAYSLERASLASFQPSSLGPSSAVRFHPGDNAAVGQRPSIPDALTFYHLDKFANDGTPFLYRNVPMPDCDPPAKDTGRKICRYRAILAAAAVIVFLMTLSLLVRFVVESSFSWR